MQRIVIHVIHRSQPNAIHPAPSIKILPTHAVTGAYILHTLPVTKLSQNFLSDLVGTFGSRHSFPFFSYPKLTTASFLIAIRSAKSPPS